MISGQIYRSLHLFAVIMHNNDFFFFCPLLIGRANLMILSASNIYLFEHCLFVVVLCCLIRVLRFVTNTFLITQEIKLLQLIDLLAWSGTAPIYMTFFQLESTAILFSMYNEQVRCYLSLALAQPFLIVNMFT